MDLPTVIEGEELEFRDVIPAEASRRLGQAVTAGDQQRLGRDIMIAIDHGPMSRHAFDWALANLCRDSDTIHLIHAVSSVKNEVVYEMSRALMEKLALEAANVAMVKTTARIVEGDASKVICQVADKLKPAAVVLGTRGRSLVKSVLQGSVSQYCLHHCKSAPIIVVPGKVSALIGSLLQRSSLPYHAGTGLLERGIRRSYVKDGGSHPRGIFQCAISDSFSRTYAVMVQQNGLL